MLGALAVAVIAGSIIGLFLAGLIIYGAAKLGQMFHGPMFPITCVALAVLTLAAVWPDLWR